MDTAKSFEARFQRILQAVGARSESELARILEIHPSSVGTAKKRAKIPTGWIEAISERFGISANWLFFGSGAMHDADRVTVEPARAGTLRAGDPIARVVAKPSEAGDVIECADCELVMVPMVEARLSAGTGSFETGGDIERRYAFRTDFLLRKGAPSSMVLMRVDGDSMDPYVLNGDVVLIDQSQREPRAGKVYAVGVEDVVYLKRVNAVPGKIILSSYNPDYPPIEVDARGDLSNGIRIIGRAVWVGRELN